MAEIVDIEEFRDTEGYPSYLYNLPKDYEAFQEEEAIPTHADIYFDDLTELETGPWERTGQRGAYVNLLGASGVADLHIHELEPEGQTAQINHLYENMVFVLEGRGITTIGNNEEVSFEWAEDSAFYIPPGMTYRHINTSRESPKLVAQTNLPQLLNSMDRELVIDYDFNREVDAEYYSREGALYEREDRAGFEWDTAFIPDIKAFDKLQDRPDFGAHRSCGILQDSDSGGHIADTLAQQYKTAHRHGPGATVFILNGEGYELLWNEDIDKKLKVDWSADSVYSPPARWWHHRFNLTEEPSRHFAFHPPNYGTLRLTGNPVFFNAHPDNRIEYVDEDPAVREHFEAELAKRGLESKMPEECYTDPDYQFTF